MSNYPDVPILLPVTFEARGRTFVTDLELGGVMRRKAWAEPLYRIKLKHRLSSSDYMTLDNFFREVAEASANAFTFTDPISRAWTDVWVNTGDGSTGTFDVPGKGCSAYTVYIDGVGQTSGVDYLLTNGGGTDGRASIAFTSPPAAGERISIDATMTRAWWCIFSRDKLTAQFGENDLATIAVELFEVRE